MGAFEELWSRLEGLPDAAIVQAPSILSSDTKKKLNRKTSEEIGKIVKAAIDEVNKWSVETIDALVSL